MTGPSKLLLLAMIGAATASSYLYVAQDLFWDDAAIVLKYFDEAKAGCIYCYNHTDGPVFGVSSFLYGLVGSVLAYSGLFTSEGVVHLLAILGFSVASMIAYCLIEKATELSIVECVVLLLGAVFYSTHLLANLNGGMETPLYVCSGLAAIYAAVTRAHYAFWICSTLFIEVKLDALPLVLALSAVNLFAEQKKRRLINPFVFGFLVPVILLAGLKLWLFSSLLPLSMVTKFFYQSHPIDRVQNVLARYFENRELMFAVVAVLGILALIFNNRRNNPLFTRIFTLLSITWLIYLTEYLVFNPRESMSWYYVFPDILISLAFVICLGRVLKFHLGNIYLRSALLLLVFAPYVRIHIEQVIRDYQFANQWKLAVERERQQVGQWIKSQSSSQDRMLTGFGYIAREAGLYNYDLAGLNSKQVVTDGVVDKVVDAAKLYQPEWIVVTNLVNQHLSKELEYRLVHQFYDHTLAVSGHFASWKVYRKIERVSEDPRRVRYYEPQPQSVIEGRIASINEVTLLAGNPIVIRIFREDCTDIELMFGLTLLPGLKSITAEYVNRSGTVLKRSELTFQDLSAMTASFKLQGLDDYLSDEFMDVRLSGPTARSLTVNCPIVQCMWLPST